ncbi:MAG: Hsp70 family protein [Candidatus Cloacimonadota bacterium]|jgi:hypothetical protein|nr:Hsp70 family protein [Candidatus Cloacimonadota bacterium]
MNTCPHCNLLISSKLYSYCPNCREVVRKLELSCPDTVYNGMCFTIALTARGIEAFTLNSLTLDGDTIDSSREISPGTPVTYELRIDSPGEHQLIAQSLGKEISKTITCVNIGSFNLSWQNIQEIDAAEREAGKEIYVSRELADRLVIPSRNTGCPEVARISLVTLDKKEFEFKGQSNGFRISDDFFSYLEKENSVKGELRVLTSNRLELRITGLEFIYRADLPDLKISHDDYLNQRRLAPGGGYLSFVLKYQHEDKKRKRPIDSLKIRYLSPFINTREEERYFDNEEKIEVTVRVDLETGHGLSLSSQGGRLEIKTYFALEGCDAEFIRYFDILFGIQQTRAALPPPPQGFVVAVDFGTTNTCIAFNRGNTDTFFNPYGQNLLTKSFQMIPTTVLFDKLANDPPYNIRYGEPVERDIYPPLTFAVNFKPRLERDEGLNYYDIQRPRNTHSFRPSELTRMYVDTMIDKLTDNLNHRVENALFSYPADFSFATRTAMHGLFRDINLITDQRLTLTEPENIALYFALEEDSPIQDKYDSLKDGKSLTICVFDCGGGTTDISVVRVSPQPTGVRFEILATWGTDSFSGNYLTYLVGSLKDGDKYWFPQNFSMLYTARNEELEEYFKFVEDYEAIKCNYVEAYSKEQLYEGLAPKLREEIGNLYDKINKNILYQLFQYEIIDQLHPDFLILAGNSCKLPYFYEEAKEYFSDSQVIWEPEKGKAAVVLGALRAHQMSNSLEIKGTSLSKYEYLYRRDLSSPKQIFKPLIDMNKGDDKTLKGLRPRDLRILGRKIIGDQDEQPVILFTIPGPNCTADESTYSLKLKFINKTISYRWIEEREGGYEEKEYKEIYNES